MRFLHLAILLLASLSNALKFAILHFNDVYELNPLSGLGGLSRVATVRNQLMGVYGGNVITVLAGDLISPSALDVSVVNGTALQGRQMIAGMNAIGVDYASVSVGVVPKD